MERNATNPYDELPYHCRPIEWTAPERLAVASLLHGGPRLSKKAYAVLELGCGNGANILPQAYYRRSATFVGVDGARSQIEVAEARRRELGLRNVEFIYSDFESADQHLKERRFDIIIGHGIFSWISDASRDAVLALINHRLSERGLVYLNYNAYPGWKIRGMVRDFLLAQVAEAGDLHARARSAKETAARVVASMTDRDRPYSQLLIDEFTFVCESDVSYVAHEFLAEHNHPYWRSEFMALARQHGLEYVADADFNYPSGRLPPDLALRLSRENLNGCDIDDTIDLLCHRQLHSPILSRAPVAFRAPALDEFSNLTVASCLERCAVDGESAPMYLHPSGFRVEAKEALVVAALDRLRRIWPRGLKVSAAFDDVASVRQDLELLHRNGLIDLRCTEPVRVTSTRALVDVEAAYGGYVTTPYHTLQTAGDQADGGAAPPVG